MPILVQDVMDRLRSALDAEGSDHYNDTKDLIPAINSSVNWLISVINATLGHKKLGEEVFRELKVIEVHKASKDSRISFRKMEFEPWTILAVYPKSTIGVRDGDTPVSPINNQVESIRRDDHYHISADHSAKRLTIEEWATNKRNPFEAGYDNEILCDDVIQYAYLDPFTYNQSDTVSTEAEIEVRPSVANKDVTVFYIKKPEQIVNIGDSIEFPQTVFSIIFNKSLQYISYKQGDQTNAFAVTAQDISTLIRTVN